MGRYPPGSRTSRHAGPRCCNHPHVTTEPAAGYLGSYPLDDSAIALGSAQTLLARNRQPLSDRQLLFLKTRSSHLSSCCSPRDKPMKCWFMATHFEDSRQATVFLVLN